MSVGTEFPPREQHGLSVASSPGLSSPPTPSSPTNRNHITSQPSNADHVARNASSGANHGGEKIAGATNAKTGAAVKRVRKTKDADAKSDGKSAKNTISSNAATDAKDTTAKPKKPRAPNGTSTTKRKSKYAIEADAKPTKTTGVSQRKSSVSKTPASAPMKTEVLGSPPPAQLGNHEAIQKPEYPPYPNMSPLPPRTTSGQHYDPIRSATIEPRPYPSTPAQNFNVATFPQQKSPNNASASLSIASLIDPPTYDHAIHPKHIAAQPASPPPPKRQRLTPPEEPTVATVPRTVLLESSVNQPIVISNDTTPMDVDNTPPAKTSAPSAKPASTVRKSTTSSGTNSPAAAPKPREKKEVTLLPPTGTGNGLLSSAMLGGSLVEDSKLEKSAPTVVIDFDLKGQSNQVVNFSRMAEEKYGFDALHPRLAAQRARLARVAAAGAALENAQKRLTAGASADDASDDLADGDGKSDDSNVEMDGVNGLDGTRSGVDEASEAPSTKGVKKRAKRVMKEDQYNVDDDFIDDSELAWEENAATTKDGFFVYMGPLVPEEDKSKEESQPDPPARRGRGGGGPGSRGGRGSRGGTGRGGAATARKLAAATDKDKDKDASMSKPTNTSTEKPKQKRVTKKDKEMKEAAAAAAAAATSATAVANQGGQEQQQIHVTANGALGTGGAVGLQQPTLQMQVQVPPLQPHQQQQRDPADKGHGLAPFLGPLLAAKPPSAPTV